MIVKVTRGGRMLGAVQYLAADKEGVVRENPRIVAGLGREDQALDQETIRAAAHDLDAPRRLFGTEVLYEGKPGHVWACGLALKNANDGILTDEQWRRIGEDFAERMGFVGEGQSPCRWMLVRHGLNANGHDHAHVLAGVVREDGTAWDDRRDWVRAGDAANAIEHRHGLTVIEARERGLSDRGYHGAEKAIAERLHGKGTEPAPDYIRRVVRAAAVEAPGRGNFERYLSERNVTAHPRLGGYSYSVPGSRQYQGSKLAPDLSWPRIQARWASPVPQTADQAAHRAAGKLAAASLRTERTPGPLARESRELGRFAQTRSGAALVLPLAVAQLLRERIHAAEREAQRAEQYLADLDHERRAMRPRAQERGAELDL